MSDPTQNDTPAEGQPADGEELPEETVADQPEGEPEATDNTPRDEDGEQDSVDQSPAPIPGSPTEDG